MAEKTNPPLCGQCIRFTPFPAETSPLDVAKRFNIPIVDASVSLKLVVFTVVGGEQTCSFEGFRTRTSTCARLDEFIAR